MNKIESTSKKAATAATKVLTKTAKDISKASQIVKTTVVDALTQVKNKKK